MTHLYLYHTLGCHLCEEAEAILAPLSASLGLQYTLVDIADDDALVERYGIRIPVLCHVGVGRELDWPFTEEAARAFLQEIA